jgi:hypothetical protein
MVWLTSRSYELQPHKITMFKAVLRSTKQIIYFLLTDVDVHYHGEILPIFPLECGGSHLLGCNNLIRGGTLMDLQIQRDWKVQFLEILDYLNRLLLNILPFIFMLMCLEHQITHTLETRFC